MKTKYTGWVSIPGKWQAGVQADYMEYNVTFFNYKILNKGNK